MMQGKGTARVLVHFQEHRFRTNRQEVVVEVPAESKTEAERLARRSVEAADREIESVHVLGWKE